MLNIGEPPILMLFTFLAKFCGTNDSRRWRESAGVHRVPLVFALLFQSAGICADQTLDTNDPPADEGGFEVANLAFRSLSRLQGLDARTVTAIEIDADGFLWVGSREGVYRYDGTRALRFDRDATDPDAISDTDIRTMYLDPRGELWISTNTGGLNLYLPGGGFRSWRNRPDDPNSLSYDSVYGVAMSAEGRLWVGTQKGLNLLDPVTGEMQRVALDDSTDAGAAPYVYPVEVDPNGDLWVGTVGSGLYRRPRGEDRFEHIDLGERIGDPRVNDVFAMHWVDGHGMFIGTRAGVVHVRAGDDRVVSTRITAIPDDIVTAFASDAEQRLLIATLGSGLLEFEPATGTVRRAPVGSTAGALPDRPMLSLEVHDGQVFVGTLGAGMFVGERLQRDRYAHIADGLRNTNIMALVPGDRPGEVFVGTFGGGVQRVHAPTGHASELIRDPESPARNFGVSSMARGGAGHLYAGSTNGLWRIQPDTGDARLFNRERDGLGEGYVTALLPMPDGGILIGTGGSGVFHLDEASERIESMSNGSLRTQGDGADYVTELLAEGPDAVWVGTRSAGLFLCRLRPWTCHPVASEETLGHHNVTTLIRDRAGVVWIASDGGGVWRVLPGNGDSGFRLEQPDTLDGMLGNHVMGMVEDADGSLWLTSRGGLVRLDARSGNTMRLGYQLPDGADVFNAGSVATDDEYLYFGSVNGLLMARRGTEFKPAPIRPLRFTRINAPAATPGERLDAFHVGQEYRVPEGATVLVEFAVLDFLGEAHSYEYRTGADADWRSIGRSNVLTLSGLQAGYHRLHVRGRVQNAPWSVSEPIGFRVVPPFWRTPVFRGVVALLLLLALWAWHRARLRSMTRRNRQLTELNRQLEIALRRLESSRGEVEMAVGGLRNLAARLEKIREDERREISRELHDELGQVLTAAKLGLQLHKTRFSVRSLARSSIDRTIALLDDAIRRVRSVSQSLRPPLLEQTGLVPALRSLVDSLSETTGVTIELTVESEPGLPVGQKIAIFRIIQEAVNNALKHGQPDLITIALRHRDNRLTAEICDDGDGFDGAAARRLSVRGDRLGLLGMMERARVLKGELEIWSQPGKGCRIRLTVPTEVTK